MENEQIEQAVKGALKETYNEWEGNLEEGWKVLTIFAEMFDPDMFFEAIDGDRLIEEVRKEMESL